MAFTDAQRDPRKSSGFAAVQVVLLLTTNHCSPKSLQNPFQTTVAKFTISSTCNFKNLYKNNGKITKNIYKSLKSCKKLKKFKKKLKKKQTKNKKKKKKVNIFQHTFCYRPTNDFVLCSSLHRRQSV